MAAFNRELSLAQIQEEFAKKEQIIKKLTALSQFLLSMYVNPARVVTLIPIPPDLRRSADAVSNGQIVYLRQAETNMLYQFDANTGAQICKEIPCKYVRCSMIVFDNTLVTVGGATTKDKLSPRSDELLSFVNNQWTQVLPSMPTKRSRTTALTYGFLIVVIGGEDEKHNILTTVEILDTRTRQWYRGKDLPEPRCCSSGTIVNDCIYILGGWRGDDPVSSVLRCTLADMDKAIAGNQDCIWQTLPNLPVEEAACTSFRNTLLVIGGRANKDPVREIRTYDPVSCGWIVVGYLQKPRYICFAIGLPDRLIVLGGRTGQTNTEDTMEIFS